MGLINQKNISKIIIYIFIVIMTIMVIAISSFYVHNTYEEFETQMKNYKNEYYSIKKKNLKKEVNTVIDIIQYNIAKEDLNDQKAKEDTKRLLNNISFQEKESNYFFVYEIKNIEGGNKFAKFLVNPSKPSLVGEYISSYIKDINGLQYREKFLNDIKKTGESFIQYAYWEPGFKKAKQKLTYLKLYDNFNWVIANGIYIEDIENEIMVKRIFLKKQIKDQITQNIILFVGFLLIGITISFFISNKIDELLQNYQDELRKKANELKALNKSLEIKVQEEVKKNLQKEQLLIEKSKFIALGEMISNIAHQWRQPLSQLSSILMLINFKNQSNTLDNNTINKKLKEADNVLDYMSNTIEDFRNFFKPKKEMEFFSLSNAVNSSLEIISSSLTKNNINVIININKELKLKTYLNEYKQVILNIISNSRDALIQNNIKNPIIKFSSSTNEKYTILSIEDNGGGIRIAPIDKIFEPYYTTKPNSSGTGIGLYMSKTIVEKNMGGFLKASNKKENAIFNIYIPKNFTNLKCELPRS